MSPAAKTPGRFVCIVFKSILIVPQRETAKSSELKSLGKSSGSKPSAFITISALRLYFEFSITIGFLLPDSSGSPSFIFETSTLSTFCVPINLLGFDNHKNSTPSSIALPTSLADPGIFSLSLL